jgi:hypothetical protein
MKWASLIIGLILFIPSASAFAIIRDLQNIPIIGQIMADLFRVTPVIPLIIAIIGFVLIVNGFRTSPTKLTVKDAQQLGLVRNPVQRSKNIQRTNPIQRLARFIVNPQSRSQSNQRPISRQQRHSNQYLDILKPRLAKGEITIEQYEELKEKLN